MSTAASSPSATLPWWATSRWAFPTAIFVVSAALVSIGSWNVSIWTDEAVTISASSRSLPQLWELVQHIDAVHAVYYAVMSMWVDVFGLSEFCLRLPSALAFGGTVAGVFAVTRRVATPGTALVATAVCATLPRMTWAGIEARPFVFSALVAVWLTWALLRAMRRPRTGAWVLYGVLGALAVLVNIYLVLLVVSHGVTVLVLERRRRRIWFCYLIAAVAIAVAMIPFLLLVRSQQAQLGGNGDRSPLSILRKIVVNQVFLGETPSGDAVSAAFGLAWQAAAIIAAVIGLLLAIVAVVRPATPGDDKRTILAMALPWLVLPTLVIAAYSVLVSPVYHPRYFTFAAPGAALLIALGFRALERRWLVGLIAIVYLMAVVVVILSQRTPFAKSGSDWAEAAATVREYASPEDAVYFAPRYEPVAGRPITLTSRRIADSYPDAFAGLDDVTLIATGAETASLDGESAPINERLETLEQHDAVWMLYGNRFPDSVIQADAALFEDAGYSPTVRWSGPGSTVVEYQKAP